MAIALLLVVPSSCTFARNVTLVDSTQALATDSSKIRWDDGQAPGDKAQRLDAMRARMLQLDEWKRDGAPIGMRWGMYAGDTLYPALRGVYVAHLRSGFSEPVRRTLLGRLESIDSSAAQKGEAFNRGYDDLKTYLMMSDLEPSHLDPAWVAPRLVRLWITALKATPSPELEAQLRPHVDAYVDLVKRGEIPPWKGDKPLITRARSSLLQVPQVDREYEALVRDANYEIASIRFDNIFYGSIAAFVTSKKNPTVDGAYTKLGWLRVRELLEEKQDKLVAERWVLGEDEKIAGDAVKKQVAKLRDLYFERYKNAWRDFLASIEVHAPDNNEKALEELNALSEPEWPYLRLLRTLNENTQLEASPPKVPGEQTAAALIDKGIDKAKQKVNTTLGMDAGIPTTPANKKPTATPVELAFKPMSRFAIPEGEVKEGSPPPPTGLSQYIAVLGKLIGVLTDLRDSKAAPDPKALSTEVEQAYRQTSTLLAEQDGFTRPLLSPLLMRPIALAWAAAASDMGGSQSGLWELSVWQKWNQQLEKRYPFTATSPEDASVQDFAEFFKPKSGLLWGFFEANLKGTIERHGDSFVPTTRF
ncbi:MAG: ImcF-related family protein, partial [Polyangiales bacterium]